MQYFRCLFFALIWVCSQSLAQESSHCPKIMTYIQEQLPLCGVLKMASNGFVYVDVDDTYIHSLIPFIQEEGFEEPPYFGNSDLVGAHISVIYSEELKKQAISTITECGQVIYFTLKECKVIHPSSWKGIDEVYVLVVEAPELNRIRKKYGLPKAPYAFHITIGVKPKESKVA